MKKLILLLGFVALMGCAEPNNAPQEDEQDYTSFVFEQTIDNLLPNCIAGYFDASGYCWKIADLGDLSKAGQQTREVIIEDDSINEINLFTDYFTPRVFRRSFQIKKNTKNVFKIKEDDYANEVDKADPKQYPQEKSPE